MYMFRDKNCLLFKRQWPGNQRTNIEIQPKKQKKKNHKTNKIKEKKPLMNKFINDKIRVLLKSRQFLSLNMYIHSVGHCIIFFTSILNWAQVAQ
jgi:hypothetical protein